MAAFDREKVANALREHGSIAAAARSIGCDRRRLSEFVNADPDLKALRWSPTSKGGDTAVVKGDDVEVTTDGTKPPSDHEHTLKEMGLDPDEWYLVLVKRWETYHGEPRLTTVFRRRVALAVLSPARHVPKLVKPVPVERPEGEPELIVVEGDHQAPYHDPGLDACATAFVRDTQPVEHVFLGDTADFPTISRHPDHPAAMATAQECIDSAYALLRRRAEAAPNAKRYKLKGNHDWRLEQEILQRSERIAGLHPAGETDAALSLRRLLQLDALGVELVEDKRGWQHAEVVLVPGGNGLVVRHGLFTGAKTAQKTMAKLGVSIIVGHGHQKESAFRLTYPKKRLQQGMVAGTMSRNDEVFPHFATSPDWHQGFCTVERWPDGTFIIEHAHYFNETLYWRDRRWRAKDYV